MKAGYIGKLVVDRADVFEGGGFGLVGEGKLGEKAIRWEMGLLAFFEEVLVEGGVVGGKGGLDDGVSGLIGLDNGAGGGEVAATNTAEDLSEEVEGALFGGIVGEGKSSIGLDDADGGKVGEIEAAGESLSADEDVDVAVFDGLVLSVERDGFGVVGIKAGDSGLGKELFEFGFKEFGAEAFVDDAEVFTGGTFGGNLTLMAAGVTDELVGIGV